MTPTLQTCTADVSEFMLAYRVTCEPGREFTGADLLRFRSLPPKERAYFAALVAPLEDPHELTRVLTTSEPDANGRRTVTADPSYPEPCACARPMLADYMRRAVRCSRCLHAWPIDRSEYGELPEILSAPLVDSVQRSDMGHAIERMGA